MTEQSALLLGRQLKGSPSHPLSFILLELSKRPVEGFSAGLSDDNIYDWDILIIGPPETLYEGGFFKAKLIFPKEYPQVLVKPFVVRGGGVAPTLCCSFSFSIDEDAAVDAIHGRVLASQW